jgi:hypothetical protein
MKSHRFSLTIAVAISLSLVFAFVLSSLTKTSVAAPAPTQNDHFKGKVVFVTLASQHCLLLDHVCVRKIGEQNFLVGMANKEGLPGNWIKGRTEWIPMTQVELIVEFDSVEQMKKASEDFDKLLPKDAPPNHAPKQAQ